MIHQLMNALEFEIWFQKFYYRLTDHEKVIYTCSPVIRNRSFNYIREKHLTEVLALRNKNE